MYNEQKRSNLPKCWYYEVMNDLEMLNTKLNEDEIKVLAKKQWKSVIWKKIIIKIEDNIKKDKCLN